MTTKKRGIASVLVATIVTVMTLYVVSTVHMIVKFEQRRKMQVDEIHIYRTKINTNSKFNKEKKQISASRRDKDISHILPPRKMASTTNPIYFLHIGKTGGTSMDKLMQIILENQRPIFRKYVGNGHYDWTYIQQQQQNRQSKGYPEFKGEDKKKYGANNSNTIIKKSNNDDDDDDDEYNASSNADVITFLRHPVSRAISQFYFSKTMRWARDRNSTFIYKTLDEYLDDPEEFRDPIDDGLGGVMYLSGTSQNDWIQSNGIESRLKISLRHNKTAACIRAAKRLDETTWFGLLEDLDKSMKLLQFTMDLESVPVLPKSNAAGGTRRYPSPSKEAISLIEGYLAQDIWLYEYSKRLFDARWGYYFTKNANGHGVYIHPDLPTLPKFHDL